MKHNENNMKYTKEIFIKKAIEKYGNKYDYSKVNYVNSTTPVCIICPKHGEFWQIPASHLRGYECNECANEKRGKHSSVEKFVDRAKEIHGNKYDYSKVEYKNAETHVTIICPEHGEFKQTPSIHLRGCGCPKCKNRGLNREELINEFKKVHGEKYDYSLVEMGKLKEKVKIICPIHGVFEQSSTKHLIGHQCPKCAAEKRGKEQLLNTEIFIKRAKEMWGETYDYSKVNYVSMSDKVEIICPKHGSFFQRPYDHLQGYACPKCGLLISRAEDEIENFILENTDITEIIRNDRSVLNGKEIDIYIPSLKIGIEYNGLLWHSEYHGKDCHYHLDKTIMCEQKGVKLIHIFEDEYTHRKNVVLNKILHLIKCESNLPKIMGRKCTVNEISKNEAKTFLNEYHIQGYGKCTISIGCFYEDELIAVMSFLEYSEKQWELVRFASDTKYICQGVGGKLFKYFIDFKDPLLVKTFADRRWTIDKEDNLYTKLGFMLNKILKPDYRYINIKSPNERIHKFNFRKKTIRNKYHIDSDISESEMTKEIGFSKIWDCGLLRYIWKKSTF